ncbi:MAG TPA: host attachment protein [Kofleriaceae bacterium]|nr:host attachment protein [Kofleriaceae bacterium]
MYKACIAVIDAARARLFVFTRTAHHGGVDEQIVEQADLFNPARRGPQVRPPDVSHHDQAFAAAVAAQLGSLASDWQVDRVVLCASPRMLGILRGLTASLHRPGRVIDELPRDLVRMSASELRTYLAAYGLLPPRETEERRSITHRRASATE